MKKEYIVSTKISIPRTPNVSVLKHGYPRIKDNAGRVAQSNKGITTVEFNLGLFIIKACNNKCLTINYNYLHVELIVKQYLKHNIHNTCTVVCCI